MTNCAALVAFLFAALAAVAPQSALAHYKLTNPPTRGMIEEQMVQPPCGNFNQVQNPRTAWNMSTPLLSSTLGRISYANLTRCWRFELDNPLSITAYHPNANFTVYFTLNPQPLAVGQFAPVGSTFLDRPGNLNVTGLELTKLPAASLTQLGVSSLSALNGKQGTIMTVYDAGDGVLYQCADVVLQLPGADAGKSSDASVAAPGKVLVAGVAAVVGALAL